jgi:hypothetical protein
VAKRPKTSGLHPGEPAPSSGLYEVRGPRGGRTGREVTAIEGRPLPPVEKGRSFTLTDKAKHPNKR